MNGLKMMKDLVSNMKPGEGILAEKIDAGGVRTLVLKAKGKTSEEKTPALIWIHGGGYFLGMKEMAYLGRAADLAGKYGVAVFSPGYRLAFNKPYPAALKDCWTVLRYMIRNADELGIDKNRVMVGGESAGGGLTAALCMLARDKGIKIAWQFPLYPMLSYLDTETSKDNHGRVWNTRRNHLGWRMYLGKDYGREVSAYASPLMQDDYSGLPPAYTFVGDGEPFYAETLEYIKKLQDAGVEASADVYHTDMHAFDMLDPEGEESKKAIDGFNKMFEYALSKI